MSFRFFAFSPSFHQLNLFLIRQYSQYTHSLPPIPTRPIQKTTKKKKKKSVEENAIS